MHEHMDGIVKYLHTALRPTDLSVTGGRKVAAELGPCPGKGQGTTTLLTTAGAHDAFPTEARMKQKEKEKQQREEEGTKRTPVRRKRTVEAGNDDCGDDLSGLGSAIA